MYIDTYNPYTPLHTLQIKQSVFNKLKVLGHGDLESSPESK